MFFAVEEYTRLLIKARNASNSVNEACNQATQDIKNFIKQAAEKHEGFGKEVATVFQELGKELHKRFAGLENLARIDRCEQFQNVVESIKLNEKILLEELDVELKRCLIDLVRFEEEATEMNPNDLSSHGTSSDKSAGSLKRLKLINRNLSKQINECRNRLMYEKSSISGNTLYNMSLDYMNVLCFTFFTRKLITLIIPQAVQLSTAFGAISTAITVIYLVAQFFYRTYLTGKASAHLQQLEEALRSIETKSTGTLNVLDELCELACSRNAIQQINVHEYISALEDKINDSLEKLSFTAASCE
ncbi:hypothetical protein MAM1_0063c03902 [Mucor ambiguus]|uniref:Uncharacterized protein n=1 Tax=Mucor ambiguus TaxID=91626 RepID=A0A0C9MMP4_9FUNG|nr:hypothetical protein MAM1_0063c03902 [Mucor ambiguus]